MVLCLINRCSRGKCHFLESRIDCSVVTARTYIDSILENFLCKPTLICKASPSEDSFEVVAFARCCKDLTRGITYEHEVKYVGRLIIQIAAKTRLVFNTPTCFSVDISSVARKKWF